MRSVRVIAILCVASFTLVLASGATAATPQQIHRDLTDNGRLDQRYSDADLKAALASATLAGYPDASQEDMAAAIESALIPPQRGQTQGVSTVGSGRTLPFTGIDLVLIVGIGLTLVLVGTALRRLRPRRATEQHSG